MKYPFQYESERDINISFGLPFSEISKEIIGGVQLIERSQME